MSGSRKAYAVLPLTYMSPSSSFSTGSCEIAEAETLVSQAADLKASFDAADELGRLCRRGRTLLAHFASFQRLLRLPEPTGSSGDASDGDVPLPDDFVKRLKLHSAESTPRVWLNFYDETCSAAAKLPFVFPNTEKQKALVSSVICST